MSDQEVLIKKPRKKTIKPPAGPHHIVFPDDYDFQTNWKYAGESFKEIPENVIGFVYCITNLMTGRKYIGKKNFFKMKTRSIKKQAYRERVQSDFLEYYGSNDDLKHDVAVHGTANFHRNILLLCTSVSMMSYWETKYIFHYDCIISPDFYNHWVTCKITNKHVTAVHLGHTISLDYALPTV